jgi:drug/metabolite transporter (DMT)-like permease
VSITNFITPILALAAALSWGGGDFSGGLVTRRAPVLGVVAGMYGIGVALLLTVALVSQETVPSLADFLWGGAAGLSAAIGLASLYQALSIGKMGIGAMLTAVLAASLPVAFGVLVEGVPDTLKLAGFALAIVGVVLISWARDEVRSVRVLGLSVLAGLGFGGFFILIDRVESSGVFWPLLAARATPLVLTVVMGVVRRKPWLPERRLLWLILLAGFLDVGGNVFFVLAARSGRLDVSVVLSSLYPAVTVLLARLVLGERMTRLQTLGIVVCMLAIPLIAV